MKNLLIFFSLLFTTQLVAQNVTNAEAADKAFQAGIMEGSILQGFVDDPLTIRIVDPANHGDLDATGLQNAANVTVTYNRIIAALTADFGDLPRLIAQADSLNALAEVTQDLEIGLAFRTSFSTFESMALLLGYNLNEKLRLGYAFDLNTAQLRNNNNNTHEIVLNYCFTLQITPPPIIRLVDPRRLDRDDSVE